jgi:hypothetical protein
MRHALKVFVLCIFTFGCGESNTATDPKEASQTKSASAIKTTNPDPEERSPLDEDKSGDIQTEKDIAKEGVGAPEVAPKK